MFVLPFRSGLLNEGFDRERNNPFGATSRDDRADDITPDKFRTQQQQIIAGKYFTLFNRLAITTGKSIKLLVIGKRS